MHSHLDSSEAISLVILTLTIISLFICSFSCIFFITYNVINYILYILLFIYYYILFIIKNIKNKIYKKKPNPTFITLSGKIGSGKDYIYNTVILPFLKSKNKNVLAIAFGDFIKIDLLASNKENVEYEGLFCQKTERTRKLLQEIGMKRRKENPNVYIEIVNCLIKLYFSRGIDTFVILDCRMSNELYFCKGLKSYCIRIIAGERSKDKIMKECCDRVDEYELVKMNRSEIDLDGMEDEFDFVLRNDYCDDGVGDMRKLLGRLYD